MSDKTTTLYKGDVKRRVGTAKERRQLLAAGWSEKAPQKAAPVREAAPEPTPAPQPVKPQPKPESK